MQLRIQPEGGKKSDDGDDKDDGDDGDENAPRRRSSTTTTAAKTPEKRKPEPGTPHSEKKKSKEPETPMYVLLRNLGSVSVSVVYINCSSKIIIVLIFFRDPAEPEIAVQIETVLTDNSLPVPVPVHLPSSDEQPGSSSEGALGTYLFFSCCVML